MEVTILRRAVPCSDMGSQERGHASLSYDISLCDPITMEPIELDVPHFVHGGTYCPTGSRELSMGVTYNYSPVFKRVMGQTGIRCIYGLTGAESMGILTRAIEALDNNVSDDYWECTDGNAKRALCGLLLFASYRPDGIWKGD